MAYRNALVAAVAVLLLLCGGVRGQTPSQQLNTYAFLKGFADQFPSLQATWNGTDYCTWPGVSCDASSYVTLNLSRSTLSGVLPAMGDVVGADVMVTSIDLSNNPNLGGDFREDWGKLSQLNELDLSFTAVKGMLPDSWNGMVSLQRISVASAGACGRMPNWAITSLEEIDVSFSAMRGSLASSWTEMTNLRSVNFEGNNFCGCVPSAWQSNEVLIAALEGFAVTSSNCNSENVCKRSSEVCGSADATGGSLTVMASAAAVTVLALLAIA